MAVAAIPVAKSRSRKQYILFDAVGFVRPCFWRVRLNSPPLRDKAGAMFSGRRFVCHAWNACDHVRLALLFHDKGEWLLGRASRWQDTVVMRRAPPKASGLYSKPCFLSTADTAPKPSVFSLFSRVRQ